MNNTNRDNAEIHTLSPIPPERDDRCIENLHVSRSLIVSLLLLQTFKYNYKSIYPP